MVAVKMSEMILPAFHKFWRASRANEYLYYVLKGGRNSSKSTHIAIDMVYDLMRLPINMLVLRKVDNTLQDSVYEQLKWAIDFLDVGHLFHINISPLRITYKPRGNKIIFRGANKPERIKSIKSAKFPIARLWIEELAEFATEDEVTTIVNSVIRADLGPSVASFGKDHSDKRMEQLNYKVYFSYNPPKRKQSWVNKKYESNFIGANTFVHHSSYLDNPHASAAFIEEAEEVKKKNFQKYRWEYLGEAIGAGIVPFTNIDYREITNADIKRFDNIRQGLDWGYGADPLAFVRMHYDKTRRQLFIFDEFHNVKTSNREIIEWLKARGYDKDWTIADSAEPKSVDELRAAGVRIKGAKKGPGSVEYGEKWLDDLAEIVIDPARCPKTAKEFEDIDYMTDTDGNIKNRLQDDANHSVDACRYGCEDDMRNKGPIKAAKSIM